MNSRCDGFWASTQGLGLPRRVGATLTSCVGLPPMGEVVLRGTLEERAGPRSQRPPNIKGLDNRSKGCDELWEG